MWKNLSELFNMPVGYLLLVGIAFTILCTILKFKTKKESRGYNIVNCDSMKSVVYFYMLINQVFVIYFVIEYILGVVDETGAKLDKHILLFLGTLFFFHYMFLWCHYNKIHFNDNEIIVYRFLKKTKIYSWNDIVNVKRNKMKDIILKTINENKITVEFSFDNIKKLEKKLEEKNIVQIKEKRSIYGRKRQ